MSALRLLRAVLAVALVAAVTETLPDDETDEDYKHFEDPDPVTDPALDCLLPAMKGPCNYTFPRWRYNERVKKCYKFIYGGCKGNANNFPSRKVCQQTCAGAGAGRPVVNITLQSSLQLKPVPRASCLLPAKAGPCFGHVSRWAYNKKMKECRKFTYGGCRGNANNFFTKKECQRNCLGQTPSQVSKGKS